MYRVLFICNKKTKQQVPNKKIRHFIFNSEEYQSDLTLNYLSEKENKKIKIKQNDLPKTAVVFILLTHTNNTIQTKIKKAHNRADKLSIKVFKTGGALNAIEITNYIKHT